MLNRKNTKKNHLFPIILGSSLLILLVGGGAVYALTGSIFGWNPLNYSSSSNSTPSTSGNNPPSQEQINNGSDIKKNSVTGNTGSGSDTPASPVSQPDGRELVQVGITSVNKIESITRVSTLISTLDNSGSCTITVKSTNGSVIYTNTVGVQAESNTSTCKGFDLQNSILPSQYSIVVDYTSSNKYGSATYANS